MTDITKTYCNPIPLPDYPIGRFCYNRNIDRLCDYRETADPTVIYEDGVWYLYPSCGMVYYTDDFVHWKHRHMEPYDCGYAPTVVKHRGKFYLLACFSNLYVSDSPLGDFVDIGEIKDMNGNRFNAPDPMLFSDDDGRLFLYSGSGKDICCCELDSDNPTRMITENKVMFSVNPAEHKWERNGDFNENSEITTVEGAWMIKHNGKYYLTYSAPGTEYITYAMGAYVSDRPDGDFRYTETSPFISNKQGIIKGTGHGSVVKGPNDTYWCFYTLCMCYGGKFERRIALDPLGFDENGNIMRVNVSETPSFAPGVKAHPEIDNLTELLPVTQSKEWEVSSSAEGREGLYAIDDSLKTWWQPADDDKNPSLTVCTSLFGGFVDIYAMRIIWRDVGLNVEKGFLPGAFGYRVDALDEKGDWICVLDKSDNGVDMNIDYQPIKHERASRVRLTVTKTPENIKAGVINFTVFGK